MDIVERLRHAATTASNDDLSSEGTEDRRRHVERIDAMLAGADEIEKLRQTGLATASTSRTTGPLTVGGGVGRTARHEYWRDALLRAAECGSDCLRDTWVSVPSELRDELGLALRQAGIIAMDADVQRMAE
jgi:hypothetical protein